MSATCAVGIKYSKETRLAVKFPNITIRRMRIGCVAEGHERAELKLISTT